ncbi:thiamine pyrophosphate-binding protein [Salinigranum salinum]|uniref:thiamine pyrophosphate-binding protein n=1 Tax=Salinigranum salinum TaxID=1364937 RepID=UPI001260C5BC|nr:thiamine pyrophosphate-binding protein [Salinigranum salinum]
MPDGATQLVRSLAAHDVSHVFGVCGDTSVGLYHALAETDAGSEITHVLARDERAASFMADAYARLSGRPGVCEGPSGGGATYLLPGLAEANDSCVPVVGLNTTTPVRHRGRGVLTELDQTALFAPVTKWNASADHPDRVPGLVREAFRRATAGRPGATHLALPMDTLADESDSEVYASDRATRCPVTRPHPVPESLDRAADRIRAADRPVIVAGGGVHTSRAWTELRTFAETAELPVAETLTSVGCIGDSPWALGVVGENGGRDYATDVVVEADLLLLAGTAVESVWTAKWSQPPDRATEIVHVDVAPESIGKNYETTVAVAGDLRVALDGLLDRIDGPVAAWDADDLRRRDEAWRTPYVERFDADDFPLRPERLVAGANEVLGPDAVLVSDPGTTCPYFASLYEFTEPGRHWLTPRAHGALGYAVPGVVGAHYARPDATVVGLTGDGSLGTCLGSLETLARLDVPVTVVVVNNDSFSWIEAGQRNFADFSFGVDFGSADYAAVAAELGLAGFRVDSAAGYEEALAEAVAYDGPALVDVPTMPLPAIDDVPVDWLEPGE